MLSILSAILSSHTQSTIQRIVTKPMTKFTGPSQHIHLGDGLYASHDGYQVWLTANDPRDPSSPSVALAPTVVRTFARWLKEKHPELYKLTQDL